MKMGNKKGLKVFIILGIVLLVIIVMCVGNKIFSSAEKVSEYAEFGKQNAINYIYNKYGFIPNVISVEDDYVENGPIPDIKSKRQPSGWVYVKMEYNTKEFYVYILGSQASESGSDNYQYDEIVSDIINEVKNIVGVEPYRYDIKYGESWYKNHKEMCRGLIEEYYDKNNISEISMDIKLDYTNNASINNIENQQLSIFNKRNEVMLINYKSIEDCNASSIEYISDRSLENEAMHINNAYIWEYTRGTYYNDFNN